MLNKTAFHAVTLFSLAFFLNLLISCKLLAQDKLTAANFDKFITEIEQLKDSTPSKAFDILIKKKKQIQQIPIEQQLVFHKLLTELYVEQAFYQKSKEAADEGLALALTLSNPSITSSELLYSRGFAQESLGDYKSARDDYLNGLEIADSLNDKKIVAVGLINIGALDYLEERFDRSLIMFNDALVIANKIKDNELLGYIYSELGILYSLIGEDEKSLSYYLKSKQYYLDAGKFHYAYNTLRNIAVNYAIAQEFEKAIEVYQEIIANAEEVSNKELLSSVYTGMAWAQIKKKDKNPEASYQYMRMATKYMEDAEQVDIPLNHAVDSAYLFFELERYPESLESIELAGKYFERYKTEEKKVVTTLSKLNLLYLKGEIHYKLSQFKLASETQDKFVEFALSLPEKTNVDEVEDLRMRYESQQADIEHKLLAQRQTVQELMLNETNRNVDERQWFIAVFSIVAFVLAWVLIKIVTGQRQLLLASRTDVLTGVSNRRYLMEQTEKAYSMAVQHQMPLSIFLLDIDDFKQVNDKFGHKVGDKVLTQVAKIGQSLMRETDAFGRFGGEEFIAVLPHVSSEQACAIAERLREQVSQHQWHITGLQSVTLSIGVATMDNDNYSNCNALMKKADELMYKAKNNGKDQVKSD